MSLRNIYRAYSLNPITISSRKFQKILLDDSYQIVQIIPDKVWKQDHILFSVHLTPTNFLNEYKNKLDPNKKIVIYGENHSAAEFYRVLDLNNYNVYLIK